MKQHLLIKEFFGHNENAIQIQIYTAIADFFKNGQKWQIATKDSYEDELQLMLNF